MTTQKTISPVDGSVYVERNQADLKSIDNCLKQAKTAQRQWRATSIEQRQLVLGKAVDAFVARQAEIAEQLTWQMGRPISQTPGEVRGFEERARFMLEAAPVALANYHANQKPGFERYIKREPLGVVAIIAPWNYPYLTAVNGIIPALMAGNSVILKHSAQTPLCAEQFAQAFSDAGLPEGVFQYLHLSHQNTEKLLGDRRVDYVNFTGSVEGGYMVQKSISSKFINAGLELGGKDPAYVRADADLDYAVENLVDGSFFNSGQSCCGIERIYVHEAVYDKFIDAFAATTNQYRLGDPTDSSVNLGPMVKASAAAFVREQIADAIKGGARALVDERNFPASQEGTPYLAPQVLVDVDHTMRVMCEESFGPVIGIMKVKSDEQAIAMMNDSEFGLTASVWTADLAEAEKIGDQVETGTFFMNRCDYLDPALAWTGVKDSGRGCTLSEWGYEVLTRPKSFHLKVNW
jgi:acyl-CoA reductase-like NAD-dependent aldehyde dehydrogenase